MSFIWLKRYMPRGLYGRAALILALPVFGLQLIVTLSFFQRHFEDVTTQMTRSVAYDLRYLATAVRSAPDLAAARAAIDAIAPPLDLEPALPAPGMPARNERRFYDLSGRVVLSTLKDELDGILVTRLPDDRNVFIWLSTPHGPMMVEFDRGRVSASNPHQLLVLMIILGILLTTISFIYLRNQLRPITRMAAAAEEFGKGRIVRYQPSGATEVRAAGRAFLEMRSRIERHTQSRTLMLSGVSHDLRTPLTRLRLALSMLDDSDAEPMRRDLDEMQHLLDSFLDFARGDAEDDAEIVDPVDLVRAIVRDAARSGRSVALVSVEGPEGETMRLRAMALRRGLDNLIDNGLRYGTRAEVSVLLTPRSLRVIVEDDGPGIPPEHREEAMRPFVRLDRSRNQDRGSGVGLGLAIVADVARAHGGSLVLGESTALGGLRAELRLAR
ncbi:ATP-binding protein [Roseisalinus antarcticus]|uniref:histidine kinase n=1 Tax=Roseisalinus antarcticus TaxID=254357 RepID=A0A1Y5TST6_9RHOB|nr:ATP-binding protein [Roseisalinus antarcticus]SLN71505.1 Osmolarity sensor protein EnvZ [Roseisalinus antarcticus]